MQYVGFERAMEIASKMKDQFVFDMAQMEGNTATFEQVQTITDGISVSDLTVREVEQVDGISRGWKRMLEMVHQKKFTVTKDIACYLNMIISANENYNGLGGFRIRGVRITGTDYIPPNAKQLDTIWDAMLEKINTLPENQQAMYLYMEMARNQYFGDGNKRTALTMMNGMLLCSGYAPLTVSKKENQVYRKILLKYYEHPENNRQEFYQFLEKKQGDILNYWGYSPENEEEIEDVRTKEIGTKFNSGKTKKIHLL